MKKKLLTTLISLTFIAGTVPGIPVMADGQDPETCTVTFVTDGQYVVEGEGITENGEGNYEVTVNCGETAAKPDSPVFRDVSSEDDDVTFLSWITKPVEDLPSECYYEDFVFDFNKPVTEDIFVYAASVTDIYIYQYDLSESKVSTDCGTTSLSNALYENDVDISTADEGAVTVIWGSEVWLLAEADEGYYFSGWSGSESPDDITQEYSLVWFIVDDSEQIYALFDKTFPITVTLHSSSINGEDEFEPIVIETYAGIDPVELFSSYLKENDQSHFFESDAYSRNQMYISTLPMSEFSSYDELEDSEDYLYMLNGDEESLYGWGILDRGLKEDLNLYAYTLIPVPMIEFTITPPEIGSLASETPFEITVPENAGYGPNLSDGDANGSWCILAEGDYLDVFEDVFEEGTDYYGLFFMDVDFGYTLALSKEDIVIHNGELYEFFNRGNFAFIEFKVDMTETPTYSCESGNDQTITPGSGKDAEFIFKSDNGDDSKTFEDCTGIFVDGKAIPETVTDDLGNTVPAFTLKEGSLIVTLKAAYLNTLSEGSHTLTVNFRNGQSASAEFTVKAASSPAGIPSTGESMSSLIIPGVMLIGLAILSGGALVVFRKKRRA